jgi:hypothetical protein
MITRHIVREMDMRGATHGARMFGRMLWLVFLCAVLFSSMCFAIGQEQYVDTARSGNDFCLAEKGHLATLYVDSRLNAG